MNHPAHKLEVEIVGAGVMASLRKLEEKCADRESALRFYREGMRIFQKMAKRHGIYFEKQKERV